MNELFYLCVCIGYTRIVLALVSFYFMPTNHVIATWTYICSSLLDAVDGYAARYLNQGILSLIDIHYCELSGSYFKYFCCLDHAIVPQGSVLWSILFILFILALPIHIC